MAEPMRVIVTGSSGFLGTALCARLEAEGHEVVRLNSRNADLRSPSSLHAFEGPFDQIFHLAAWTQAGDFCLYHPGEQWLINQQINTTVLGWWQERQPQAKLVSIGTSCAYAEDRALVEENYLEGEPIESLFTYAHTKRMLYVGLRALHKQFGMNYLTVVPSTLYGAGYHTDGRQMHFIFDLIRKILRGKLYGEPVVLWGNGHQRRELVFVEDFVSIMLRLNERVENDLVNIGAGEEHTIREFAQAICDIVGYDFGEIQFDESRYVGAKSKVLSVARLRTLLPDVEMTPLQRGLARTVEWFQGQPDAIGPAPSAAGV
jgi:GDP-L-fucose synthase